MPKIPRCVRLSVGARAYAPPPSDAPFRSLSLPFPLVVQENRGYSPLHFAARFGAHRNALALLEKGAHPNMPAAVGHLIPENLVFSSYNVDPTVGRLYNQLE